MNYLFHQFSSVQSLSRVRLFVTPWTAAHQASLPITNSWSLPKLISIESVMPSNHLILCRPLLLLPSIFPNMRVFSNESALRISGHKGLIKDIFLKLLYSYILCPKRTEIWPQAVLLLLLSHFSRVRLCANPETAAYQAPLSLGFSRQEYWSGLPFPSPMHESEKRK